MHMLYGYAPKAPADHRGTNRGIVKALGDPQPNGFETSRLECSHHDLWRMEDPIDLTDPLLKPDRVREWFDNHQDCGRNKIVPQLILPK